VLPFRTAPATTPRRAAWALQGRECRVSAIRSGAHHPSRTSALCLAESSGSTQHGDLVMECGELQVAGAASSLARQRVVYDVGGEFLLAKLSSLADWPAATQSLSCGHASSTLPASCASGAGGPSEGVTALVTALGGALWLSDRGLAHRRGAARRQLIYGPPTPPNLAPARVAS
jgi:hypothetical protein